MKKLLLLSLLTYYTQINAQNVGIGNPAPNEKLDVTGNINVTGTIKANGVGGAANQVLSKNNANNLAWANTAHANNTRFKFRYYEPNTIVSNNAPINQIEYNLNTTNVVATAGNNYFQINKTGLYHFDVAITSVASTAANPAIFPQPLFYLLFTGSPNINQNIVIGGYHPRNLSNNSWIVNGINSFDIHIVAPTTIYLYYQVGFIGTSEVFQADLNGHLIAE